MPLEATPPLYFKFLIINDTNMAAIRTCEVVPILVSLEDLGGGKSSKYMNICSGNISVEHKITWQPHEIYI
jgi:hypothetical protein